MNSQEQPERGRTGAVHTGAKTIEGKLKARERFSEGKVEGKRMAMEKTAKEIRYKPIGTIHSPFKDVNGMPIQPTAAKGVTGTVEVNPAYAEGLKDIEGFSHITLIYHFHLSKGYSLEVKPFMDDHPHGVFATRAPRRPNPIGISVVKLVKVEGHTLQVEDLDIVDGTPLLDIKPYVPEFDVQKAERTGWLSKRADKVHEVRSDERFR